MQLTALPLRPSALGSEGSTYAASHDVLFLFYDYVYLAAYKGLGYQYLIDYWYLTGFSVLPWVVLLIRAKLMSTVNQ